MSDLASTVRFIWELLYLALRWKVVQAAEGVDKLS
jgi:hypothetical protein